MAASLHRLFCLQKLNPVCFAVRTQRSILGFGKKKPDHKSADTDHSEETVVSEYNESPPAPPSKLYQAPDDVEMKILALAGQLSESTIEPNTHLDNTSLKYQILTECEKVFDFEIVNIDIAELTSLSDVIKYYNTSRSPQTTEEKLQNTDLPPNLHLQLEPFRFTEKTKHMYDGKTAFPHNDTVVTSLKYKNVYEGFKNTKRYEKKEGYQYY